MPNQPRTPNRAIRVPDEVWFPALARAEERGETLSEAVRAFLVQYARPRPGTLEQPMRPDDAVHGDRGK